MGYFGPNLLVPAMSYLKAFEFYDLIYLVIYTEQQNYMPVTIFSNFKFKSDRFI